MAALIGSLHQGWCHQDKTSNRLFMKKLFNPASFLLYVLSFIVFFFIGATFASISGAAKNQGLASGAIAVGYALMFSMVAVAVALFIAWKMERKIIARINWVLTVLLTALIAYTYYNVQKRNAERAAMSRANEKNAPVTVHFASLQSPQEAEPTIGLGFFKPHFSETPVLYFYGNLNYEKPIHDHPRMDSAVFTRTEHGSFDIAAAPPWLVPAHLKLDYDILYFRIVSVGRDFAEVIVNERTQQSAYVNRYAGTILYWHDFFLNVFSVEFPEGKQQPIRIKPLTHASEVKASYEFLNPLEIQDEWMRVQLMNENATSVGTGWLQWRSGNKLLIEYSLLS